MQWNKILGKINADKDLNKDNIIEKIKNELQGTYAYQQWEKAEFNVNNRLCYNWTLLHMAAAHGCKKTVDALLAKGADVSVCDSARNTPLHIAAEHDRKEIVEILIENGANPLLKNNSDQTPMDIIELQKAQALGTGIGLGVTTLCLTNMFVPAISLPLQVLASFVTCCASYLISTPRTEITAKEVTRHVVPEEIQMV